MLHARNFLISKSLNKTFKRSNVVVTSHQKTIEDIPRPKSLPLLGTKLNFVVTGNSTKLHKYVDHRHKTLGPIFRESLGGGPDLVFISDPDFMKTLFAKIEGKYPAHILPDPWVLYEKLYGDNRGLFFMNGEEWLHNRRVMNKHLLKDDADKWLDSPIKDTVTKFLSEWRRKADKDIFMPDLDSEFYKLSINVILRILMGSDSQLRESEHNEELLTLFSETVKKIFQTTTKLYSVPVTWYQSLNLKTWRDFKESVDLSLYLAQKIVTEMLHIRNNSSGLMGKLCQDNMNEETIKRIVADFIIAAGDTTAYTTQWILYLIAQHDKVKQEVREKDMFVKFAVKESMRLYPVAPFLTRIIPKECSLGVYKLKSGTPVIASIYTSGRDEQYFSRADEFLPHRWDRNDPRRQELTNHVPSASLPFAIGGRSCIGKKIAMLQLTEVVKQIVDNFDFKCTNSGEIEAITSQVLVPNQDIKLVFSVKK